MKSKPDNRYYVLSTSEAQHPMTPLPPFPQPRAAPAGSHDDVFIIIRRGSRGSYRKSSEPRLWSQAEWVRVPTLPFSLWGTWASYLTSLHLRFLTCKAEVTIKPTMMTEPASQWLWSGFNELSVVCLGYSCQPAQVGCCHKPCVTCEQTRWKHLLSSRSSCTVRSVTPSLVNH